MASTHVGLDGGGDVGGSGLSLKFGVVVWRRVDHQLHRCRGLAGGVGRYTGELPRILQGIRTRAGSNVKGGAGSEVVQGQRSTDVQGQRSNDGQG